MAHLVRVASILAILVAIALPAPSLAAGNVNVLPGSTGAAGAPSFQPGPCPVTLDTPRHVDCGMLIVPEKRTAAGSSRTIKVAIAIVRARHPLPDPIMFSMGGPDYPAIDQFSIEYFKGAEYAKNRDIILMDIRGTGSSKPFLGCPELDQVQIDNFPNDPSATAWLAAMRACHDRLVGKGIDPSAYGFIDAALDMRDLRLAMGIDQWNLVALSAGGETGLELMRLDPAGIRSVILDSEVTRALQPTVDYYVYGNQLMEKAFRGCARQADCAAAYPDLQQRFYDEVRRLDQHPVDADIAVAGGGHVTWHLDGAFILDEGAYLAGFPDGASVLPGIADFLARGHILDYVAGIVLDAPVPVNDFLAQGRTWASRCRDAYAFQNPATIASAIAKAPKMARFFDLKHDRQQCAQWDVGRSDPAGHGYIASNLPVLTVRGEWDNAPVDAGHILGQARHFPNGFAYTFPNRGHIQLFDFNGGDISCQRGIATAFMADPDVAPDSTCISYMPRIHFDVGEPATAAIPPARAAAFPIWKMPFSH